MGGGMPGGMPAGMGQMMAEMMQDPEMMAAMSNPKVMQAMQSCMGNPMAMMQYMDDPEVGPVLQKLMGKMMGNPGSRPIRRSNPRLGRRSVERLLTGSDPTPAQWAACLAACPRPRTTGRAWWRRSRRARPSRRWIERGRAAERIFERLENQGVQGVECFPLV